MTHVRVCADAPGALARRHAELLERCARCIPRWRERYCGVGDAARGEQGGGEDDDNGTRGVWQRLMKKGPGGVTKMLKEVVECAPVIAAALATVEALPEGERATIVDLCCGKGFMSMFLAELLPAHKVRRCVLVDKCWPMHGEAPGPRHISPEHIYFESQTGAGEAEPSAATKPWPVPMECVKRNLKKGREQEHLRTHVIDSPADDAGPTILLAVHLCGRLAVHAVRLFNESPHRVSLLALKPCCLPAAQRNDDREFIAIGGHRFCVGDVSCHGRFVKGQWRGETRSHLRDRFESWCDHLLAGMDVTGEQTLAWGDRRADGDGNAASESGGEGQTEGDAFEGARGAKDIVTEQLQTDGGYQNEYLFARRTRLAPRRPPVRLRA